MNFGEKDLDVVRALGLNEVRAVAGLIIKVSYEDDAMSWPPSSIVIIISFQVETES